MFLFHWCLNAIGCRRDTTLETLPLSPTKYNGLPPALDGELQRQLADDIPPSGYDVAGVRQSLLDDFPRSFHNRQNPESVTAALHGCDSEWRNASDVTVGSYFRPDEPIVLSSSLSTGVMTTNDIDEHCDWQCEAAATAAENTGRTTYSCDASSNAFPSFTDFCVSLSQLTQTRPQPELQYEVDMSNRDSSLLTKNDLRRNTQAADDVGLFSDSCVLDVSHRNADASFPADTVQDSLVTVASTLVNFAFNSAVKILNNDFKLSSKPNPAAEIGVSSVTGASNSVQPPCTSDESVKGVKDPVEAVASRLVSQMLSDIVRKDSSSVPACFETFSSETAIMTTTCSAPSHYTCSPCCESRVELTANSGVETGASSNAACGLVPDEAVGEYLSESSATGCTSVDERQVLAAYELVRIQDKCDCSYALNNESMKSLSDGRLAFVSKACRPVSPPFSEAYSPDDVSGTLNNSGVVVGVFDDDIDGHRRVSDDPSPYDHLRRIDSDAQAPAVYLDTMAEQDIDLSGNSDADHVTINLIDHWIPVDDKYTDKRSSSNPFTLEKLAEETWNSYESSSRPEDYFFHRYVIPVDQLEASEATLTSDALAAHSEREEQRSKMQLDLKVDEANNDADIDADIEAVAAFCRAMFTPIETDTDDNDDRISAFDVSSPETPDAEQQRTQIGRPVGVRRCISLRTSPGTPHKKKSVRFADALGLDLEYVRQIQSVDEPLPTIASDDDERRLRRPLLAEASAAWRQSRPLARRYLCACFQAPGVHPDFIERVHRSRVVLESCDSDDRSLTISGVIRVANVAYRKIVAARVTTDGWTTQTDVAADYVPRSNDGTTDRFSFQIVLPRGATDLGRRVEFAVYFTAFFDVDDHSETYWDNNYGANYCYECYACDSGGNVTLDVDIDIDDGQFATWLRFV